MFGKRTDLAVEAHEIYSEQAEKKEELSGVRVENFTEGKIKITKVVISDRYGAESLGKPMGTYITLECDRLMYDTAEYENMCGEIAKQIRSIANVTDKSVILVAGLGNESITPDALGPKVVSKLMITRHMKEYMSQYFGDSLRSVCAVAPGVLGTTGIESAEIVKGVCEKIKPDLVIAVDALASRSMDRISTTFQIADTGICPGEGIGNRRIGLNRESLGVPVIAVGVPTVIDAVTIANDSIEMMAEKYSGNMREMVKNHSESERKNMIAESLSKNINSLVVTPKDIDEIIEKVSKTVANGINLALHRDFDLEDIQSFVE